MKQPKRILAYSALALLVMLAAFGAIAFDTSNVAHAQSVPMAPTLTAQASGASTINLSWTAVTDAARYELWAWDNVNEWQRLDGGETTPLVATSYSHTGLTSGTTYYYQVRAINDSGDAGAWSARVNEVAGTAPARPVLTATPGYLQITVSWTAVPGAARYELWAWDNSWTRLDSATNQITGTSYTHTGLTGGRTYYYQARSVDSNGVMSAWSGQVNATVLSSPNISAPTSFTAARGDQMITLNWAAPASVAGLTLAGYEYRYAASTGTLPATWTNVGNVTTTSIAGLTNGTTYNFELRAVSTTDAKGDVATASATPSTMPDAPVLTATEGYRLVMLSWTAPENNGAAITAYHVEMLNTQNQWVAEASLPGTATSYTDRGLNDSAVYTYRLIAENVAGRSSASNSADATTLAQPAQVPGPPSSITATAGAGMVTLTWGAPLFNGGAPITRYEYRYKLDSASDSAWGQWMSAMTELTVDVKPLTPLMLYDFEVRARNSVGPGEALNSDLLDAAAKTPTATGPTAVPSLRSPSLGTHDGTVAGHESNATITVSWVALGPAVNGGAGITGYELCYKKSTDSAWMRWTGTGFADPVLTGSNYSAVHGATGGELDPGTTYQYRARALNSVATAGTADTCTHWDGAWSNVVSATTPIVEPAAPTLHAAAGDTTTTPPQAAWSLNVNSITIRWTAPTDNGGAAITSYEVWVGSSTSGTDAAEIAALSPTVTNLPPSRTEFISVGLSATTEYFYRVRARNGSGNDRVGVWSGEQAGTTTASEAGTPDAPTIGSATPAAAGDVTVTWTAPGDNGASPILGYEVQYQRVDDNTPANSVDNDEWATSMRTTATATSWVHMQAPGLSSWVYRVRAVNGSGAGAWSANSNQADVVARAPDAPMLTATAEGPDEIMLQWNIPESNGTVITGFAIQQWDNQTPGAWATTNLLTGPPDVSADDDLTVFAVTGLDAGTTYYYRIQAVPGGDWSTADGTNTGATSAMTAAGTPAMLPVFTATAAAADSANPDSIALAWTAHDDATNPWSDGGSDITGFQIRVWDGSSWMPLATPAAGATTYTHDGLDRGARYYYTLAARNSSGLGPWSDAASAMTTPGAPDAPVLTAVATGATSIQLSWTVPDGNGATITGYELVKGNADNSAWDTTNLLGTGDTVTRYEDTGLTAGTQYFYRIRALPQTGDAGWSANNVSEGTSATTHGDTPGRPTWAVGDFTATASSLALTWVEPTDTGGSDITGYELRIWNGSSWVVEATLGNVLTYTDMNLDAGTKYYYIVRAMNSQGAGLWSAFKAGTTTADNPDAPVLTATATGMTTVRLTWTVPDDNGNAITGYTLQRWNAAADPAAWGTDNLLGTTDTNRTLFVDTERDAGTTYYYRIQATTAGTPGAWSTIKSAATHSGRPGRPTNVTATADGQNAIDLSWTVAMANGSAIVRYELQRWDPDSNMWMTIRNDLPSTRTSYKDSMLTAGTRYVYRLRAINRSADNNGMGRWSTITFAITAE